MRLGVVLAGVCALIASTYFVVFLVRPAPLSTGQEASPAKTVDDAPTISPKGPYPKAVIDETDFDFGRMEVGEERSHAFTIRNQGEAPLVIRKGPTTCQCTVSEVESGELAPGKSAKITLTWKPTAQAEQFGKGADILTNDPDLKVIHLRILGMVAPRLTTVPQKNWEAPDVYEDKPTVFIGMIVSPVLDQFQIIALESTNPAMSAEAVPIEKSELEAHHGLSGYRIRVSIKPEMPVGSFSYPLTIKTDVPGKSADGAPTDTTNVEVLVSGHRRGPIRFLGPEWYEEKMAVIMGSFDSAVGKKVTLPMVVRGAQPETFQLTGAPECEPKDLKATLERDEKAKGTHARFLLTLEYPAGSPPRALREQNPAKVRFHTNQPGAEEIELSVWLNAF